MPITSRHSPGPVHTTFGVDVSHVAHRAHSGATVTTCAVLPSGITAQCSGASAGAHATPAIRKTKRAFTLQTLQRVTPAQGDPIVAFMALREVTTGVWIASDPVRIVGTRLSANMTVLRLEGGALLLHSPVSMTPERHAAVESLGEVAHLYAPNTFHHRWIGEWAAAFPNARVHAPSALAKVLRIDRAHDKETDSSFSGILDEQHFAGFRLHETALVHRASRSLVVADLAHNVGRAAIDGDGWTKFYTRMMGFYDRVALSRFIRWTAFSDKGATRSHIDLLLSLPFDNLLVGHGEPVLGGAHASFANVYAWLTTQPRALPARSTNAVRGNPCG